MNDLLFEMIAARATAAGNPAAADMLARLRSSSGGNAGQTTEELLAHLGSGNPVAALLAKQVAASRANAVPTRESPIIDIDEAPENPAPVEKTEHDPEAVSELRRCVQSMFAELKVVRERTDLLASALGACCLCWGQDPECRSCKGRGQPGFSLPDEKLFAEFVLPAIRMLRAQRARMNLGSSRLQPQAVEVEHPTG